MDDFNLLETIRNEIHAEHTLISHRITWYATSQAFLMTAYAVSWNKEHEFRPFFKNAIPILGVSLSVFALVGVGCAIWVQWYVIKLQESVIGRMRKELLETKELRAEDVSKQGRVDEYVQITGTGRKTRTKTHWLAMIPPLAIPLFFLATWIVAYCMSRHK